MKAPHSIPLPPVCIHCQLCTILFVFFSCPPSSWKPHWSYSLHVLFCFVQAKLTSFCFPIPILTIQISIVSAGNPIPIVLTEIQANNNIPPQSHPNKNLQSTAYCPQIKQPQCHISNPQVTSLIKLQIFAHIVSLFFCGLPAWSSSLCK